MYVCCSGFQVLYGAARGKLAQVSPAADRAKNAAGNGDEKDRSFRGSSVSNEADAFTEGIQLHSLKESENGQSNVCQD